MKERKSKFELLRIVCMLFVVTGHLIPMICDIENLSSGLQYYVGNIYRSFCLIAVNCFVIISGYFGLNFSVKKLVNLEIQCWFWGVSGLILAVVSGIHTVEIKKDILYLFPIITKRYWFVTIYIVLCLLSPILNYVIHILNQKQFRILMGLFLVLFYLIPVISYTVNAPTITGDSGYGIVNFICLYFVGRYIRIYDCHAKRIWASVGFLASCLMMFLANHAMSLLMGFYFNSYVSYDTIFTLAGATFLFLWCQEWNFQSAIINKIAEYSFSVYIIHMSMFYGTIIFQKAVEISENTTLWYVVLFVVPILFYAVSIVLESIRRVVFNKLDSKLVKVTSRGMIGKFLDTQLKEFIEGYNGYGIK